MNFAGCLLTFFAIAGVIGLVVFITMGEDFIFEDAPAFYVKHFTYRGKLKNNDCGCYNCKWRFEKEVYSSGNYQYYCSCPMPDRKNSVTGEIDTHSCVSCFGNSKECKWEAAEVEEES